MMLAATIAGSVLADDSEPVARWDFGTEESTRLTSHGNVRRDQAGPMPPEFPDFAENNTAVRLDGTGAHLSVADDVGPDNRFDFTNDDSITLEAWVRLDALRGGQPMYIIGKGRTGSPQFARNNQNWALRVVGAKEKAHLSFLFATAPGKGASPWHRWTSEQGFILDRGWHHVAVGYQFGKPESICGWIDGKPTDGKWDKGGATREPPVVDDDAVWIGSSLGGNPSNSFNGWIDAVAVHRQILANDVIASRYKRVGEPRTIELQPEVMPELNDVPPGQVVITFSEALPTNSRWLLEGETWPAETARFLSREFLLPRVPIRYDDWGIRESWQSPLLVRIAGDVDLPTGKHRFLLRARSLSRLWVDGQVVARTKTNPHKRTNLEPIVPIAEPPAKGARIVRFPQQEVFGDFEVSPPDEGEPGTVRVVLELVVGGEGLRTETGEVCVAFQPEKQSSFFVLRSATTNVDRTINGWMPALPLTDEAVEPVLARISESLGKYEDGQRKEAAASQNEFWRSRHEIAREWGQHTDSEDPPAKHATTSNWIDRLIDQKIEDSLAQAEQYGERTTRDFHEKVLPILREQCFRCHGEKEQGGLRLNSRDAVLASGESELPAVIPGNPDESELIVRVRDGDMPPTEQELTSQQIQILEHWIEAGAVWPAPPIDPNAVALAPIVGDAAFLRRATLDVIGVPPTAVAVEAFLASEDPKRRERLVERLLSDERYADHWVSFWMDLLAENPTLLNASLNSTGPFRWFLYDALRDNKSLDQMVTELILMRGSPHDGGSAGFKLAAENDSPMAAKGHILASAFLGIDLQCARCHDSPYHSTRQEDLFSLAAMLARKPIVPPSTSRVPDAFFEDMERESLIRVSLKLGQSVEPTWPFAAFTGVTDGDEIDSLMMKPKDTRERLAALITGPENRRFPRVIVNHLWKRLFGAGIVQPVDDWEGRAASHPELLDWLACQFVTHDYDIKHLLRLMMTSKVYQREAIGENELAPAQQRFFNAPDRRRLTAEQVVDSLFTAAGRPIDVEELTFVHDGVHPMSKRLTLGKPKRAWMFASLNNERDRPSLALPRSQAVVDVLEAFGWTGSRQKPIAQRSTDPNVLQPGILANGNLTMSLTRAAHSSPLADLAVDAKSPLDLLDTLFLRFLARYPDQNERSSLSLALAKGFKTRVLPPDKIREPSVDSPLPQSTWTNHLLPEANEIQQEVERRVRRGPPIDPRLRPEWREVYEDVVWSLVNHHEFVWIP